MTWTILKIGMEAALCAFFGFMLGWAVWREKHRNAVVIALLVLTVFSLILGIQTTVAAIIAWRGI